VTTPDQAQQSLARMWKGLTKSSTHLADDICHLLKGKVNMINRRHIGRSFTELADTAETIYYMLTLLNAAIRSPFVQLITDIVSLG
jgi:hypothetical protein